MQLDSHLEHVGGGCHNYVCLLDLREHLADLVAAAGLDAGLVDGAGDDVGGAHRKCGGRGGGGADAAAESYPQSATVFILILQAVAEGEHCGKEGQGGAIVGVAGGIGFGGKVLGHRYL